MAKEHQSKLKFSELVGQIEKGKLASLYFINGEEEYLQNELVATFKRAVFGGEQSSAGPERLTARPRKAAELINTALEYSLFGQGKLILVYNAQAYNNDDRNLLLSFFPRIPAGNIVVLFHRDPPDLRYKYYKYLTEKAVWLTLLPLDQQSAGFWIKRRLDRYGLRIDSPAAELLIDYAGFSYSTLSEEVDKLSLNVQPGQMIKIEDVKNYASRSAVFSVFELTDALGNRDCNRALDRLNRLLESGEPIQSILNQIQRHFSHLVEINGLSGLKSPELIASKIGVKTYFVQKSLQQLENYDEQSLSMAMKLAFEAEYQSRYEQMDHRFILESLVLKIVGVRE